MSEAGQETKITIILHPDELRALMRVGMRLSDGFGMSKTKLCREAVISFVMAHDEPIVYTERSRKRGKRRIRS